MIANFGFPIVVAACLLVRIVGSWGSERASGGGAGREREHGCVRSPYVDVGGNASHGLESPRHHEGADGEGRQQFVTPRL
jgi:hypothetical protein